MPSPIPKRSDEGHRTTRARKRKNGLTQGRSGNLDFIPEPDEDWHPIAKMVWDGAKKSGEAVYYEPSDWAVLYSLCDDISHYKASGRRGAQMLTAINSMMTSLLLTEGDRRRVRIELDRHSEEEIESAGVASMKKFLESRQKEA